MVSGVMDQVAELTGGQNQKLNLLKTQDDSGETNLKSLDSVDDTDGLG